MMFDDYVYRNIEGLKLCVGLPSEILLSSNLMGYSTIYCLWYHELHSPKPQFFCDFMEILTYLKKRHYLYMIFLCRFRLFNIMLFAIFPFSFFFSPELFVHALLLPIFSLELYTYFFFFAVVSLCLYLLSTLNLYSPPLECCCIHYLSMLGGRIPLSVSGIWPLDEMWY